MKTFIITMLLLLGGIQLSGADTTVDTSPIVAQVLGKPITANAISLKYDGDHNPIIGTNENSCLVSDPVEKLQTRITQEVARDYVKRKNLKATDEEIRELQRFQDGFMAEDRIRRQKELDKLEQQLATATLSPKERENAEKYRATLLRLAGREKRQEAMVKPTWKELREVYEPCVEQWKFNKSIYEQYGGTVAITKFGPDPVGATRRLLEEYEKGGTLVISNATLRSALWSRLAKPPRIVAKPNEIDFIPFWKKPLTQNGY